MKILENSINLEEIDMKKVTLVMVLLFSLTNVMFGQAQSSFGINMELVNHQPI